MPPATVGGYREPVKTLVISDKIVDFIYSPAVRQRFGDVDMVISCGDLPYYYLEYLVSTLNKPLFYVRGNHASVVEYTEAGPRTAPWGAIDLDRQVINFNGLLMAGFEGSIRYNTGPFQYTDAEMHWRVSQMLPQLFLNRARHGRFLDLLVTHSPPLGVQDQPDRTHTGFAAFRWFLQLFKPRWMLHGHIHVYHPGIVTHSIFHQTEVINCYGYRELELSPGPALEHVGRGDNSSDRTEDARRLRSSNPEGILESD
jgi:uncharacterized protein